MLLLQPLTYKLRVLKDRLYGCEEVNPNSGFYDIAGAVYT
jgi:hypothetical protein